MSGVNLIPASMQKAQARGRRVRRWVASVVVSLVLLAVPATTDWIRRGRAEELRATTDATRIRLAALRAELRSLTQEAEQARVQLERATALRGKRPWSGMISMIADTLPMGCWLTTIATDPAVPTASAAPQVATVSVADKPVVIDAPHRLVIVGFATEVAAPHQFVSSLKDTGVFSNVTLERTNREPVLDGWYFRFDLRCEW